LGAAAENSTWTRVVLDDESTRALTTASP